VKDFKLNVNSIGLFIKTIWDLDLSTAHRVNIVKWREKRSLNQNAFQHVIYQEISKYLINNGRPDWCAKTVKRNMKNKYLGWIKKEFVDVVTGEITIKEELKGTSNLDVGDSFEYTTNLLVWCDGMGIYIKIPEQCEYRELQQKQNE
jgi:hypothetical protein